VRAITKLFRGTGIKVAFRTRNTIQNIFRLQPQIGKYSRSGIYQMKCLDCPLKYVGQTIVTPDIQVTYWTPDILYGTITDTMEVITRDRKGKYLNALEKYHIVQCSGILDHFWQPVCNVTPLKTPYGLLIRYITISHITTITHNYFLRCVTFTQLTILHATIPFHHSLHNTLKIKPPHFETAAENWLREFSS
jgi:hypothetical protein